jgi:hypothetical protein
VPATGLYRDTFAVFSWVYATILIGNIHSKVVLLNEFINSIVRLVVHGVVNQSVTTYGVFQVAIALVPKVTEFIEVHGLAGCCH